MTVGELISELQKFSPTVEVHWEDCNFGGSHEPVRLTEIHFEGGLVLLDAPVQEYVD